MNLAVKRAKPNNAGPLTKLTKTEPIGGKKDKKQANQGTRRNKTANAAEGHQDDIASAAVAPPKTSTPQKTTYTNSKEISRHTSPQSILDTFNSKDLTPADWNKMADQKLTRGIQRAAEEILTFKDAAEEGDYYITPSGFSDESGEGETSVRKSGRTTKGPSRYGDPIKHSVKLISSEEEITDLNKAALEAYRIKLATFKSDTKKPIESKFGLLERHLFRRKFGSEALDINRSWNAEWRVPLQFGEEHDKKDGK